MFIRRCLESVMSQGHRDYEVFVVDNGSSDETPDLILNNYPSVKLIRNEKNLGSASARNQGIRASQGRFIVFLDADAFLEAGFFDALERSLASLSPCYAGLTAKISQANTGELFSCGLKITPLYRSHDVLKGKAASTASAPFEVNGFNSCCAALRRSCLDEVRGKGMYFDEDFFFLFEDTDLSLRLTKKGYKFLFDPQLCCVHQGGSAPIDPQKRRFYSFRNRFYIIAKNETNLSRFFLRSFFYDIPRILHFCLTNPHAKQAWHDVSRKFRR